MRCACKGCMYNENGYCVDSSYVSIDENGECDSMVIVSANERIEGEKQ